MSSSLLLPWNARPTSTFSVLFTSLKPGFIGRFTTGRASGVKSCGSLFICWPSVCHSCNVVCWHAGLDLRTGRWDSEYLLWATWNPESLIFLVPAHIGCPEKENTFVIVVVCYDIFSQSSRVAFLHSCHDWKCKSRNVLVIMMLVNVAQYFCCISCLSVLHSWVINK